MGYGTETARTSGPMAAKATLLASLLLLTCFPAPATAVEAEGPQYKEPPAPIPQVLAERCNAGEDIRLTTGSPWPNQAVRPFDGESGVALVVIDLQPLFIDAASPWGGAPGNESYLAILPKVQELAAAVSGYSNPAGSPAGILVFTLFIPSQRPDTGKGTWSRYYSGQTAGRIAISELQAAGLDTRFLLGQMPELQPLAAQGNSFTVNKTTATAFASKQFLDVLHANNITSLIVTGTETDYCVLSTVLGATDAGIRTVVVTDAAFSAQPNSHQATFDYILRRYYAQVEIATAAEVVAQLSKAQCAAA